MTAALQHVHEADDVAVNVGMGILERIAHPGLRRKVHDAVEPFFQEETLHARAVRHVHQLEAKARTRRQPGQAVPLQLRIVVVVQIVQTHHRIATLEKQLRHMHADEPGRPCDQDLHCLFLVQFMKFTNRQANSRTKMSTMRSAACPSHRCGRLPRLALSPQDRGGSCLNDRRVKAGQDIRSVRHGHGSLCRRAQRHARHAQRSRLLLQSTAVGEHDDRVLPHS